LTLNFLYCLFSIQRINQAGRLRYEKILLSPYHFILQRTAVELRARAEAHHGNNGLLRVPAVLQLGAGQLEVSQA
jgi:hypothetical protein